MIRNRFDIEAISRELATPTTDPYMARYIGSLPNPDRVLRKLGKTHEVFADLYGDAHILGEVRSIRSGLLAYEWRIAPGADDPASMLAYDFAQVLFRGKPAPGLQWSDLIWSMGCAAFHGYAVTEVVWERAGNFLVPVKVVDRPSRRFAFDFADNQLRLLTQANPIHGDPVMNYKFIVTRHMPSSDNPYGVALFSACFWPYVFKRTGFKYFAKFAERYGIPWAIGRYPIGTPAEQVNDLADSLARMVEDAVAAVPNDSSVELLTPSTGRSELAQERLIALCNREISKALTSQTLTTELPGAGSHAAAQTHRERETTVNASDRAMVQDSMNLLLQWLTELNFQNAKQPRFEFFEESEAAGAMAEFLLQAGSMVALSKKEVYARLKLTPPRDADDSISTTRPNDSGAAFALSKSPPRPVLTPHKNRKPGAIKSKDIDNDVGYYDFFLSHRRH